MTHSENESEKSSPKRAKIESVSTKVMFRMVVRHNIQIHWLVAQKNANDEPSCKFAPKEFHAQKRRFKCAKSQKRQAYSSASNQVRYAYTTNSLQYIIHIVLTVYS